MVRCIVSSSLEARALECYCFSFATTERSCHMTSMGFDELVGTGRISFETAVYMYYMTSVLEFVISLNRHTCVIVLLTKICDDVILRYDVSSDASILKLRVTCNHKKMHEHHAGRGQMAVGMKKAFRKQSTSNMYGERHLISHSRSNVTKFNMKSLKCVQRNCTPQTVR